MLVWCAIAAAILVALLCMGCGTPTPPASRWPIDEMIDPVTEEPPTNIVVVAGEAR